MSVFDKYSETLQRWWLDGFHKLRDIDLIDGSKPAACTGGPDESPKPPGAAE